MKRNVARAYGTSAYVATLASLGWLVAWVHDWGFLSRTIDRGPSVPPLKAAVVDFALLMLFGLQHSVMARPAFKEFIALRVPAAIERSTYVAASVIVLVILIYGWHPIPATLFDVRGTGFGTFLTLLSLGGFLLMVSATFVIDHRDLFGLKQVRRFAEGRSYDPPELIESSLYRFVRHPLYLGWLIFFWATPHLTVGHALLAGWISAYILVAIPLEERDLAATLGSAYRSYRARVPRLLPGASRSRGA